MSDDDRSPVDAGEHLDAGEIEGWAEGLLSAARALHLAACPTCLAQAERERRLFLALARLPHLAPARGFADDVMAATQIPQTSARAPKD
jgi:hypothetical protein